MNFVIFSIFLAGACILALPQDKPVKDLYSSWFIVQKNLLEPLQTLDDTIQKYRQEKGITFHSIFSLIYSRTINKFSSIIWNVDQKQADTTALCEKLEEVVRAQDDVLQQFIKTAEDLGECWFDPYEIKNYWVWNTHF